MPAPDVISLRQFYSSALGQRVKKRLRRLLLTQWPEHAGEIILGLGYAPPLLRALERTEGEPPQLLAAMPARQGAIYWPVHADNRSFLVEETALPLADNSMHRIILLHALEHHPAPQDLLAECFRVLAPGGRLMLVTPRRPSLWRALGATPFAVGKAYRPSSLKQLLRGSDFTLRDLRGALFAPPLTHPFWLGSWGLWEFLGSAVCWGCGGVLVAEAEKQIYAAIPAPVKARRKQQRWAPAAEPTAATRDSA